MVVVVGTCFVPVLFCCLICGAIYLARGFAGRFVANLFRDRMVPPTGEAHLRVPAFSYVLRSKNGSLSASFTGFRGFVYVVVFCFCFSCLLGLTRPWTA